MPRITPLLIAFLLAGCAAALPVDTTDPSLPAGTFRVDGAGIARGIAYVRGYARVLPMQEPFCRKDCVKYDYVFFRVLASGSGSVQQFITLNEGNAFVGTQSIGLGCFTLSGSIVFANDSDRYGLRHLTLSQELSNAILRSSASRPVTLILTKEILTRGTEVPACYAHFTTVAQWDESSDRTQ